MECEVGVLASSGPRGGGDRDARKKRAFSFVPEGHFSRKGDDLRAKAAVELMLQEASKPASKRRAAAAALSASKALGETLGDSSAEASSTVATSAATLERRLAEVHPAPLHPCTPI